MTLSQDVDGHSSGTAQFVSPPWSAEDTVSIASAGSIGRPASVSSCGSGTSVLPQQPRRPRGGYKVSQKTACTLAGLRRLLPLATPDAAVTCIWQLRGHR